jgi:hypothetical protein
MCCYCGMAVTMGPCYGAAVFLHSRRAQQGCLPWCGRWRGAPRACTLYAAQRRAHAMHLPQDPAPSSPEELQLKLWWQQVARR